jgi:hypothetical protein
MTDCGEFPDVSVVAATTSFAYDEANIQEHCQQATNRGRARARARPNLFLPQKPPKMRVRTQHYRSPRLRPTSRAIMSGP